MFLHSRCHHVVTIALSHFGAFKKGGLKLPSLKRSSNGTSVTLTSEKLYVPHNCDMLFFKELHYHYISFHRSLYENCESSIRSQDKILENNYFSLDLIHPHWRIDILSLNFQNDLHDEDAEKFNELLCNIVKFSF
uniref:Uncharacterized protein n=1 Tax=Lactuca sativa TaxID=4236 RepID=A0A9R1WEW3_LACSA|nr:hypothetical protein LSAT_V11C200082930 [Lactuca sativa]